MIVFLPAAPLRARVPGRRVFPAIGCFLALLPCGLRAQSAGRLASVSEFPELPRAIAQDAANRGCRIPQAGGVAKPHNVIQGEFRKKGERNWALLCLIGNGSTILVYWDESGKNPVLLMPLDETITPYKNGYYRILEAVDADFLRKHYDPSAADFDRLPDTLDHQGIDDGIYEKGSRVHYFYNGRWLRLPGSD